LPAPTELMINYLPVDDDGNLLDDDTTLINPHVPLLHPDGMRGAGGVVAVPRKGERVTLRVRRTQQRPNVEVNETWEVVDVLWTMSDISRMKTTPTQVATLRMKRSADQD
jgi:hypothetical protein